MKAAEFELIAGMQGFDHVVLSMYPMTNKWELWAFGPGVPASMSNQVLAARGDARLFASLDTAFAWIREHGHKGKVTLETPFAKG